MVGGDNLLFHRMRLNYGYDADASSDFLLGNEWGMRPNGKIAFNGGVRGSVLLGSAVVGVGGLHRFAGGSAPLPWRCA